MRASLATKLHAAATTSLPALARDLLELWHLLSLDAPSVAAVWTVFFAASLRQHLSPSAPVSMFLAVWMLYVADRLLDTRQLIAPASGPIDTAAVDAVHAGLEARHYFHHRHRRRLLVLLGVCAVALAVCLRRLDLTTVRLDLVLGSLLFAYFVLIHATGSAHRMPKEISVGVFFSAAVSIPAVALAPAAGLQILPLAILFAGLCSLNCLYIYRWEHLRPAASSRTAGPEPHPLTRAAVRALLPSAAGLMGISILLSAALHQPAMLAVASSAALLALLDQGRGQLSPLTLRAAADLVLLTPLPLLWLHRAA